MVFECSIAVALRLGMSGIAFLRAHMVIELSDCSLVFLRVGMIVLVVLRADMATECSDFRRGVLAS